jgi:peptidoglycan/xylan/chitin deacetylase (PgdA/CDA1 family)
MTGARRWCDASGLTAGAVLIVLLLHLPRPSVGWGARLVASVPTREKIVALTIDDGPHPQFTPQILKILDHYQAKATFFMIGERMARYPALVREVKARGHVIGNHTFTHPVDLRGCSEREVVQELGRCEREICELTGERSSLFRPPRGRIGAAAFAIAEEQGYRVIGWTISADSHLARTPEAMAQRVLQRVSPGMIILLHDGTTPSRAMDVRAAELIIRGLLQRGYRLTTVPELLARSDEPPADRTAEHTGGRGVEAVI